MVCRTSVAAICLIFIASYGSTGDAVRLSRQPASVRIANGGQHPTADVQSVEGFADVWQSDDPRLAQPVTIRMVHGTIQDLIAAVAAQTKINVRADSMDGAGDVPIVAIINGKPASRVLDAIWSLVSYKGGTWAWDRAGRGSHTSYSLLQPQNARALKARLGRWGIDKLASNLESLLSAYSGKPEDRQAALAAVYGKDGLYSSAVDPNRLWLDIGVLHHGLSQGQLQSLLEGGGMVKIPLLQLPGDIADGLKSSALTSYNKAVSMQTASGAIARMPHADPPNPQTVLVLLTRSSDTPNIAVGGDGIMNQGVGGGYALSLQYRQLLQSLWMLDGDSVDDPASRTIVAASGSKPPDLETQVSAQTLVPAKGALSGQDSPKGVEAAAARLSTGSGVDTIWRLPTAPAAWPPQVEIGRPVTATLERLHSFACLYKWRRGVLLVTTTTWPADPIPAPAKLLAALRAAAQNKELTPLALLEWAADVLTPAQLKQLGNALPMMHAVAEGQTVLAMLRRLPDLARAAATQRGLLVTPSVRAQLALLPNTPQTAALLNPKVAMLMYSYSEYRLPYGRRRTLLVQARADDGAPLFGLVYTDGGMIGMQ